MTIATKQGLDEQTINIVKSTVPVLEENGEKITKRFYELMFLNHPELKNIFNQANQKVGKQPKALAGAIYAAAQHIDQLENILPAVQQIAHKHRSLNIKPEHYPIVGKHLLLAIKDVLGEAATDDVINAWANAYQHIADVFINVEKNMYKETAKQIGGWTGYRNFTVEKKVEESNVITSFYLKPIDGEPLAPFKPGQYLTVKLEIPGEDYTHLRQYSLSDAPGKDFYRISVKREDELDSKPAGLVSSFLHEQIKEGDVLPISAPAGDFILNTEESTPLVLLSGGVGLTPLMSMLETTLEQQPERPIYFIHAARNSNYHALKDRMIELTRKHDQLKSFVCYDNPTNEDILANSFDKQGYIDMEWLQSILPNNKASFYFCGPEPFMKNIFKTLKEWNVTEQQINFEFFGPMSDLAS